MVLISDVSHMAHNPQSWETIATKFTVDFIRLKDLPIYIEDIFGGLINDKIVYACGFGGNLEETDARRFYDKAFAYDIYTQKTVEIKSFPGDMRQKGGFTQVGTSLYCWGGISYVPANKITPEILRMKKRDPCAYKDGYRLYYDDPNFNTDYEITHDVQLDPKKFKWERLPDLPYDLCSFSVTYIDNKLYVFGGSDYYDSSFHTWTDRDGNENFFGARLWTLDLDNVKKGWTRLPDCGTKKYRGTPRMNHIGVNVGGKLYIIGGATGRLFKGVFRSVVDNWMYNPKTKKWTRLIDTVTSQTNWESAVVYQDRYIVLTGGGYTTKNSIRGNSGPVNRGVMDANKTIKQPYGYCREELRRNHKNIMCAEILVYDTVEDKFYRVDDSNGNPALPVGVNNPLVVLDGDMLYVVGGEIEIDDVMREKRKTPLMCYSSNRVYVGRLQEC